MLHLVLVSFTVLAFAGAGIFNIAGTAATQRDFARWGYPRWWCRVTGSLEIAAAALIVLPKTRAAGVAFGAAILIAAAATVLRHRDFSHLKPLGAFAVLLAATAGLASL